MFHNPIVRDSPAQTFPGASAGSGRGKDYESLQETLHLFSTRANAVRFLRGLAEARDGTAQPTDLVELAARFGAQAQE